MAEKRMFTKKIIDSDLFLDMPLSAQALYMHLNLQADDDGFVNNPKRIQRTIGASEDDLKLLIAKRFVLCFETGVIVIKHWRMHNALRADRHKPTQYQEEFAMLKIKENGAYSDGVNQMATICQPSGNQLPPNGCRSIDKNRLEQVSIDIYAQKCAQEFPQKTDTVSIPYQYRIEKNSNFPVTVSDTDTVNNNNPVLDITNTDSKRAAREKTKEQEERFSLFWNAYPKKKSKADAEKAFKKLKPDKQLLDTMLAALEEQKCSQDWKRDNGQFIPYPATWLNGRRWEDEAGGGDRMPDYSATIPGVEIIDESY